MKNETNNSSNNTTSAVVTDVSDQPHFTSVEFLTIVHIALISLVFIHLLYFIYMLIKLNCFKRSQNTSQVEKPTNMRKLNETCSICLEDINQEVQLLCSHSYCGKCIIDYAKQRNEANVKCPICRAESKLMFAQFERNEENKELYDYVLNYNHELTSTYTTSLCFCIDTFRFFHYYLKQLADFNNPRFAAQRKCLIIFLIIFFIFIIFPLTMDFSDIFEHRRYFVLSFCDYSFCREIL
jgi:hypothetical protein